MNRNVSGQFIYFDLISVLSGFAVTGSSGGISGRRCIDGGAMTLLSGNVVEDDGGLYHANLYDFDTNGLSIGYLFTASGCVARSFTIFTQAETSGRVYPASGAFVNVPPSIISGVVANSGLFVTVPTVTISGVVANSGLFVTAASGVYTASGMFVNVPRATISGVIVNSGLFVTVPPATISGVVANSGLFVTVPPATISGVFGTASLNSGQSVLVYSGNLNSGQNITLLSGMSYIASGHYIASGAFVNASVSVASGIYIASGHHVIVPKETISGVVANSGLFVNATVGSGVYTASGMFVNVPIASISGVVANSGLFTTVPPATLSGVVANSGLNVTVPPATLSGVNSIASLISGQQVQVWSGTLVNVFSGTLWPASGAIATQAQRVINLDVAEVEGGVVPEHSLYMLVQSMTEADTTTNSGKLTIFKTDGTTEFVQKAITVLSGAASIVELG